MKQVKFWRGQPPNRLAKQVWDSTMNEGKGGVIVDFEKGYHTTDNLEIIALLRKIGYPEVPLESDSPPFIPPPILGKMADIKIKAKTGEVILEEKTGQSVMVQPIEEENNEDDLPLNRSKRKISRRSR